MSNETMAAESLLAAAAMLEHASGSDHDDDATKQRRYEKTRHQKEALIASFEEDPLPDFAKRQMLANELNLSPRVVQTWFQNRRARMKSPLPVKDADSTPLKESKGKEATIPQGPLSVALLAGAAAGAEAASTFNPTLASQSSAMMALAQSALSGDRSGGAELDAALPSEVDKAHVEPLVAAVRRAAAYSAAMAYQAAINSGMAEALSSAAAAATASKDGGTPKATEGTAGSKDGGTPKTEGGGGGRGKKANAGKTVGGKAAQPKQPKPKKGKPFVWKSLSTNVPYLRARNGGWGPPPTEPAADGAVELAETPSVDAQTVVEEASREGESDAIMCEAMPCAAVLCM